MTPLKLGGPLSPLSSIKNTENTYVGFASTCRFFVYVSNKFCVRPPSLSADMKKQRMKAEKMKPVDADV